MNFEDLHNFEQLSFINAEFDRINEDYESILKDQEKVIRISLANALFLGAAGGNFAGAFSLLILPQKACPQACEAILATASLTTSTTGILLTAVTGVFAAAAVWTGKKYRSARKDREDRLNENKAKWDELMNKVAPDVIARHFQTTRP